MLLDAYTKFNIKLDAQELTYILAAIQWRIDYYEKRIKAIEQIKETLKDYVKVLKEAREDHNYHIYLKELIERQVDKEAKDLQFKAAIGQSGDFREEV